MIHSYPWYISDWRSSETRMRMTLAQRGLYRELLDYCWLEGSLPSDKQMLLCIAGTSAREFHLCWPSVRDQFYIQGDRYRHERVDEGRDKLQSWVESRRAAGRKGGLAQAIAKANAQATSELDLKPSTTTTTTTTIPISLLTSPQAAGKPQRAKPNRLDPEREAWFSEWYAFYPRHEARAAAVKAFHRHITIRELCDRAIQAVKEKRGGLDNEPKFIPLPATWLNGKRWEDEAPAQVKAVRSAEALWGPTVHAPMTHNAELQRQVEEEFQKEFGL